MEDITYIVIENDNGERWEDYQRWPESLYLVRAKIERDQLDKEWKDYIFKVMKDHNITVNLNFPTTIMHGSKIKNKKLHKKVFKENTFISWFEKTYTPEKLPFITHHDYNLTT